MSRARDIGAPLPPSGRQLRTDISRPHHTTIRQDQPDTNNRRRWGHFKASKWGQCKPSFLDERRMRVLPPEEALRCAKPLPAQERLVIENVPEEDWAAFQEALADA